MPEISNYSMGNTRNRPRRSSPSIEMCGHGGGALYPAFSSALRCHAGSFPTVEFWEAEGVFVTINAEGMSNPSRRDTYKYWATRKELCVKEHSQGSDFRLKLVRYVKAGYAMAH